MHKVKRNEPPESLLEKQKNTVIEEYNDNDWKLSKKERTELVQALDEMYSGCCAYCESSLNITSSGCIEHFRPRKLFPKLTYDYNNMNYSCVKCNTYKKEHWDEDYFSPSEEDPEKHIKFCGILACKLDNRGQKMIDLFKLNESKRLKLKESTYEEMANSIAYTNRMINLIDKNSKSSIEMVKISIQVTIDYYNKLSKEGSDYCTMIKHNFKDEIEQLKIELEKLNNI